MGNSKIIPLPSITFLYILPDAMWGWDYLNKIALTSVHRTLTPEWNPNSETTINENVIDYIGDWMRTRTIFKRKF